LFVKAQLQSLHLHILHPYHKNPRYQQGLHRRIIGSELQKRVQQPLLQMDRHNAKQLAMTLYVGETIFQDSKVRELEW
jgi:hypothetical protein